jgi:hypothetical protein
MALICCLKCPRNYVENKPACPHCGCPNYFCDPDPQVMLASVHVLIEQIHADHEEERLEKLKGINRLRPRRWWVRRIVSNVIWVVEWLLTPLMSHGERIRRNGHG